MTIQIALPPVFANRRAALAIGGLGMTQIIGWGTAFSPITIFGTVMGEELGMAREVVFSGITLMLLVSALLAPRVGRIVDHRGARPVMMVGSVIAVCAMLAMWAAHGYVSYCRWWAPTPGVPSPRSCSSMA